MRRPVLVLVSLFALTGCPGDEKPAATQSHEPVASIGVTTSPGQDLYGKRCQSCHGQYGQGGMGPSLVKVGTRLKDDVIDKVIKQGRPATGMPAFEGVLLPADLAAVKGYIKGL